MTKDPGEEVVVIVDILTIATNDQGEPVTEEQHIEVKGVEAGEEEIED